jgi:hypothetical protein
MAEIKQITFTHKEIAQYLMEKSGIKEGHWGIYLEFGLNGANVEIAPYSMAPAAIIPVLKIGIQRFDSPNPLTVDAAKLSEDSSEKA